MRPGFPVWRGAALLIVSGAMLLPLTACTGGAEPGGSATRGAEVSASASPSPTPSPTMEGTPVPAPPIPSASAEDRAAVTVVLAAWGVTDGGVEASAYVSDLVELDGGCVLHVEGAERSVVIEGDAVPTGQNVSCGFLSAAREEIGPGPWSVWITYESDTSVGSSEQVTLEDGGAR